MPYQFNMLHVLPQSKIPIGTLPLDSFINTHLALLRKKERNHTQNVSKDAPKLTDREEMEELALHSGLFMIPEFKFDHCFYTLSREHLVNDPAT